MMKLSDLNLDSEVDPALAFSELCAAFESECRLRAAAELKLESFVAQVAERVGSSVNLRSPDGLIRKLDERLKVA